MTPFLSIITRCYRRPKQLERCIASVRNQTEKDYEQLFINDDEGRGLHWANTQIHENRERVNGKFVYILDDDDFLVCNNFIKDLKEIVISSNPDVVICKGHIGEPLYPSIWKTMTIVRTTIGAPNFVVSNNLFQKCSESWSEIRAGDFHFISSVFKRIMFSQVYWWDKIVFKAAIGGCLTEAERGIC